MLEDCNSNLAVESGIFAKQQKIHDALDLMLTPGAAHELRVPKAGRYKVISGCYDNFKLMADHALTLSEYEKVPAVYVTINPIHQDLLARSYNTFKRYAEFTTSDKDIVSLKRLLVDGDPERPAGISATDEEHQLAIARMKEVRDYLVSEGWRMPIYSDSGNGAHNIFAIDLANSPENVSLCQKVLEMLHGRFSDNRVKIDRTTFNPSRICKIPGTWARKGDDIPVRPHRLSRVIEAPVCLEVVPLELLEKLAGTPVVRPKTFAQLVADVLVKEAPSEVPEWLGDAEARLSGSHGTWTVEKLVKWLDDHDVEHREPVEDGDAVKIILDPCPFNELHTGKDAAVFLTVEGEDTGKLGFKCFHDSCINKGWKELREQVEGTRTATPSYSSEDAKRFEDRLAVWAKAKGGDGCSASDGYAPSQEKPRDKYLLNLLAGGVKVLALGTVKGSINYNVECPCCGLDGVFWRNPATFKTGYECSAGRKSWQEAKDLWKTSCGGERKRRGYLIRELDNMPTPTWQVKSHFLQNSLNVVYGPANVGKSFLVIDLGLAIATGTPFLGRYEVVRGPVAYVVGEGFGGIKKRIRAWRQKHQATEGIDNFVIIPYRYNLVTAGETEVREILDICQEKLGQRPSITILDTLSRHFGGGNENDTQQMSAFVESCDLAREESDGTICVVHHPGKDESKGMRGNYALVGGTDTIIFCDEYGDRQGMSISCEKMKDADYFEPYVVTKEVIELDNSETSLVFNLFDAPTIVTANNPAARRRTDQDVVYQYVPEGKDKATSKSRIVADARADLIEKGCHEQGIPGEKRIKTAIDVLVKRGHVMVIESANPNHHRYYKENQGSSFDVPNTEFFCDDDDDDEG